MRKASTPPSGTAMTAMPVAMMSEFLNESQKSLSAKMNSNAPAPTVLLGMKNGAFNTL